jgi:hypothetical protein
MNNKFKKLNDILNINLRPWLDINKSDKKFINITKDFSPIDYDFQNLYQIDFFPSFNDKTKYYYKLINYEAIGYCNEIYNLINKNDDLKYQKFLLNDTLNKKLKTKLSEIAKLINERKYNNIDSIDPYKTSPLIDEDLKTETYIIQLLKITLVKIYLEIQNLFPFINKDDILFENDFYSTFFSEPIPNKSFLKKVPKIIIIPSNEIIPKNAELPKFEHLKGDSREIPKGVPKYCNIIKNSDRFLLFEEELYLNKYINIEHTFINKHGSKNEFAIIYHAIINKGYFKKFNDENKKLFNDRDIVKFLDNRYITNMDKQFRTYKNNPIAISEFMEIHPWLFNLSTC